MASKRALSALPALMLLTGCQTPPSTQYVTAPPARDTLYTPRQVIPGRLDYAREPDTFAPVLTHRVPYPTQDQANYAFQRDNMASYYPTKGPYLARAAPSNADRLATHVHLFACRPGTLNDTTGRIQPPRGDAVLCATDFYDARGRHLSRETVNYYYVDNVWHMVPTDPPTTPAPWINPERSPSDYFSWLPFGARSTPYQN